MPPTKIAAIVSAVLLSIVLTYLQEVYVSRSLRESWAPQEATPAPGGNRGQQANNSPAPPARDNSPRFDAWDADHLPLMESSYSAAPINRNLLLGSVEKIEGLDVQRLDFQLPRPHLCAWSSDGKTLYVADESGVLRIDATAWQATHRLDLSSANAPIKGVALTSEGIVVAMRAVNADSWEMPTPNGQRMIRIDPRTGRPPETRSFRLLVVADPDNLQVVRQYIGPSTQLAGAPNSPVVCVSEVDESAKLVDLRTGEVLDQSQGRANETDVHVPQITAFDDVIMSPDGTKLYYTASRNGVYETDVSAGTFGPTRELEPSADIMSNVPFEHHLIRLSHDGRHLAVNVGDFLHDGGYSIINTAGDGRDVEHHLIATRSTAFAFAGPANRRVANSNVMEGINANDLQWVDYDLVILSEHGKPSELRQLVKARTLAEATMLGVPTADYVLMDSGHEPTLLVKLPAGASTEKIARRPTALRGESPDEPRRFSVRKSEDSWGPPPLLTVAALPGSSIALSEHGDWLYLVSRDGVLSAFNTMTLEETRRVQLGSPPSGGRFTIYPTASGLLVEHGAPNSYVLLNYETLDGEAILEFPRGLIATDQGSNLIVVTNMGPGSKALEAYDVRSGELVTRLTPIQLADLEPALADDMHYRDHPIRDLKFVEHSKWFTCRYRFWHLFSVTDDKLLHKTTLVAPDDSSGPIQGSIHPIPERGICYVQKYNLEVHEFPSLEDAKRTVPLDRKDEIVTYGAEGRIYCRRQDSLLMRVYDLEGKVVLWGEAVEGKHYPINQAIPMPGRPERVFVLVDGSLYCVDLVPYVPK